MSKAPRTYSASDLSDVRKLRGYPYTALSIGRSKIPEAAGIYFWRYWPTLPDTSTEELLGLWERWRANQPWREEVVRNARLSVTIGRTPFGKSSEASVLGFEGHSSKATALLEAAHSTPEVRTLLSRAFECVLVSAPPLYIGKADNLRKRLSDHFDGKTDVTRAIQKHGIELEDVYISFIEDPVSAHTNDSITTALEEVIQRLTNPPFTKRYG
jgi:hypothetical protein